MSGGEARHSDPAPTALGHSELGQFQMSQYAAWAFVEAASNIIVWGGADAPHWWCGWLNVHIATLRPVLLSAV